MIIARKLSLVLLIAGLTLAFPKSADAYLDPGTGSSVLQLALAGIFASLFFLRLGWTRVKSWVAKTRQRDQEEGQGKDQ